MAKAKKVTPLMGQYNTIKAQYPDSILLFRVGDFYETFGKDAIKASEVLGIILTARNNGGDKTELAGFPHHSLDTYLPKLVKAGYRVAICDQLEKPSKEKKIVKRGVTELVTPGLVSNDSLLENKQNNFLAAIVAHKKNIYGIAFLDITTGEFVVTECRGEAIEKLLQNYAPSEVLLSKSHDHQLMAFAQPFYHYFIDDWVYAGSYAKDKLLDHFNIKSLKGFGINDMELAQIAAGTILHYLEQTQNNKLKHISKIARIHSENFMWLDRFTIRNLELIDSNHPKGLSLLKVIDQTVTPMGGRMLRKWLLLPLLDKKQITDRQEVVTYFTEKMALQEEVQTSLKQLSDLERILSKIIMGKVSPKEMVMLADSLFIANEIRNTFIKTDHPLLGRFADQINPCTNLVNKIKTTISDEPPVSIQKGGAIAKGVNEELDEWVNIITNSKQILLDIEQKEIERTGILNLKIGFNNVFGYYLNVTNKYKDQGLVPEEWIRKQTLTNAERYITQELKEIEAKILAAEDKITELEFAIFEDLLNEVSAYINPIQSNAKILAAIDCLNGFAVQAQRFNYSLPTLSENIEIEIEAGRHPVIESTLPDGEAYIPNDIQLSDDDNQVIIITGPNMSGKSAVLRQTALISILAQMGSYVPAKRAHLGLLDKIFTRVGASDNISSGESTFMVEMNETASIMNNVTDRSLVLLDEIGRGTSTYDGISIAWAIAEFLHNNPAATPLTLFATHYHELNQLASKYPRIKNYYIDSKEIDKRIIFLRKLVPGDSQHSFGIHVARMAGLPKSILERAEKILVTLEEKAVSQDDSSKKLDQLSKSEPYQLSIFQGESEEMKALREKLEGINVNTMTPVECMLKLQEIKGIID